MLIEDILEFNKKKYFGGAVQANWFYDFDKVADIASSYVFHGPKYHGVSETENVNTAYKLYDTASYVLSLLKKADDMESNRFNMTIAGYGTGKSHLSVALAALLSGHNEDIRTTVIKSIFSVDRGIGEEIKEYSQKNLVLVLNGMKDVNLNSEFLSVTKKSLSLHGISPDVLSELTKQYKVAIDFTKRNFDSRKESFLNRLSEYGRSNITTLPEIIFLLDEANQDVFKAVNEVYNEITGYYISVDADIMAADILDLLVKKFCVEKNVFKNIYILFDEFGRYIEFAANKPHIAGDSALQQIFEEVQNADGHIIFDAFIQSDLNSYIRRVESSNSNITRYVGRYENSEKYYLSSNFETVLANLIERKEEEKFRGVVENNIDSVYAKYHRNIFTFLNLWAMPEIQNRNVWTKERMYFETIAKGCYPLHPITVWFLSNTSSWMQQRSTIAYTAELFEGIKKETISAKWLKYIYPIDLISTGLFNEMLNSEEKGFAQSQYCMAYQAVMVKYKDKYNENQIKILKAVLITNILKLKFSERDSCLFGIRMCSGLQEDDVSEALKGLENEFCVLNFDDNTHRFDINAEAHGKQEYNICISKKQLQLRNYDPIANIDEVLKLELGLLNPEPTSFGTDNNIISAEWKYEQRLTSIAEINESYCNSLLYHFNIAVDGELSRGIIIYAYCGKLMERDIEIVKRLIKKLELNKYPIIISLLIDKEEEWLFFLKRQAVYRSFTSIEKEMYAQFIENDSKSLGRRIVSDFRKLVSERNILTENGIQHPDMRMRQLCLSKFENVYTYAIPFSFDGFDKKASSAAKNSLLGLCRSMFSGNMCNKQAYQGIDPKEKNRIQAVLSTSTSTSWQVFDSKYSLCEPRNSKVKKVYNDVMDKITSDSQYILSAIFRNYRYPPYGMNNYSLFLFIVYVLSINYNKLHVFEGTLPLSKTDFIEKYLTSEKQMLENLFKLRISLRIQTNDEILCELISEIDNLIYVEGCKDLLTKLKQLSDNSEDFQNYKGKIAACEMKLNDGIKLCNRLYESLSKSEKVVASCQLKFNMFAIAAVLKNLIVPDVDTPIEEYSEFLFSATYCRRITSVTADANLLIDQNFSKYVSSIKFSYAESSEYKKKFVNVAKILIACGKKEYANILKERVSQVLQDVELQQKYASTLTEAQRFISATNASIDSLELKKCDAVGDELDGWLDTFNNALDMNSIIKSDYINKIAELKSKLNYKRQSLNDYINQVLSEISAPTITSTSLQQRINNVINLHPDESSMIILKNASQLLEEYHNIHLKVVATLDMHFIDECEAEYHSKWCGTVCDKFFKEWIESLKSELNLKRQKWMESNVVSICNELDRMTVAQCVQWQSTVSELPTYLNENDINRITLLSEQVIEKIKLQKINGVVELFESLSDAEKQECLRILTQSKS